MYEEGKTVLREERLENTLNEPGTPHHQIPETCIRDMETMYAHIKPLWYNPTNITTAISRIDKEQTKREHEQSLREHIENPNTMCIYNDRSGIEGSIAVATYLTTSNQKAHQYMGGEQTTNVYAARPANKPSALSREQAENQARSVRV
jgi:hypothetical protein